jgi:hypothetical protein
MMGGGLQALMRYGQHERLLELFQNINCDVLKCISIIKKEDKNIYNMLAIFYWENKKNYYYSNIFDIINDTLLRANIYVTFTDKERSEYHGIIWKNGKSQFFCSKCNIKISPETLIRNITKNNFYDCKKCNLRYNENCKIEINKNTLIEL